MRRDDDAGAGIVGAVLLFGLFVGAVAVLNATAVPQSGLEAEERHHENVLGALNLLQSNAEAASHPASPGASVAVAFPLAPERGAVGGIMSFFTATPARASGELVVEPDYGNVTLHHYVAGDPEPVVDVGSLDARSPYGRLTFDAHHVFRAPTLVRLEMGAVVAAGADAESLRFGPPVAVSVEDGVTSVTVKARVLAGPAENVGGQTSVRVALETEAATLASAPDANAERAVLRLETAHGRAWGAFLNRTADAAGLVAGSGYATVVRLGDGEQGLDVVEWTVHGTGSGNDVRLTSGLAVHRVKVS